MKLKKIYKFCEKSKRIVMVEEGAQKFLGDGNVFADIGEYDIDDWELSDVMGAVGLTEDERECFVTQLIKDDDLLPDQLMDISKFSDTEKPPFTVNVSGDELQPFILTDGCVVFVKEELFSPFDDMAGLTYKYRMWKGNPCIFVCLKNTCVGFVLPITQDWQKVKQYADKISEAAYVSLQKGFLDAGGQMEMDV